MPYILLNYLFIRKGAYVNTSMLQQGKISEAEKAIRTLFGKERVAEVMLDLTTGGQGSAEPEAGWFDLFSSRYWKGISEATLFL